MRHDAWLNDNEYPDEKDIERFGDDSPPDYDPLTIGYVGDARPRFWTTTRIIWLIIILFLLAAFLLPPILSLLSR